MSLKYHFHIFSCPWLPQKQPPDKTQPIKCKGYTARQIFFFFTLCYLFWTLAKTTILNQRLINLCSHNFSTNIKRLSTIRRAGYINCSTVVFISFDIFRAFITSLLYTLTMQLWLVFLNLTHESKLGSILHLSTKNVVVIFPEQNDCRIPTKYNLRCKK